MTVYVYIVILCVQYVIRNTRRIVYESINKPAGRRSRTSTCQQPGQERGARRAVLHSLELYVIGVPTAVHVYLWHESVVVSFFSVGIQRWQEKKN